MSNPKSMRRRRLQLSTVFRIRIGLEGAILHSPLATRFETPRVD